MPLYDQRAACATEPVPLQRLYVSFFILLEVFAAIRLVIAPQSVSESIAFRAVELLLLPHWERGGRKAGQPGSARDECHQIVFLQLLNKTSNAVPLNQKKMRV